MNQKSMQISDGRGKITHRPKRQDIKPRRFKFPAIIMIAHFETPTERRLLWMISNYPYIFNAFFVGDMVVLSTHNALPESKLGNAQKVLHSLSMKGLVNQSEDRLKWRVSIKGTAFRITSHPAFPLFQVLFAAVIAFTIYLLNRANAAKDKKPLPIELNSSKTNTVDSSQYNKTQIPALKAKDTS